MKCSNVLGFKDGLMLGLDVGVVGLDVDGLALGIVGDRVGVAVVSRQNSKATLLDGMMHWYPFSPLP